jgi:transposase-like protein
LRTDELYVKIKGDMKYMYAIIADETRFWIAQQVAHTKNSADITSLLQKGKKPQDIPSNPSSVYEELWKGWGDWLGTGNNTLQKQKGA